VAAPCRVHLTGGNPGPLSVSTDYQPVDFKHLGFEFKKLKNEKKIPKNTS
jgi:hypothetical protein